MPADQIFKTIGAFARALRQLHLARRHRVVSGRRERIPRSALSRDQRAQVLAKTDGRCHICGGAIDGADWQADHVLARAAGGRHLVDNYLAAHAICNNYRWHYDAEEFQWILKLGVWMRTHIERETRIGREVGKRFCDYERRRDERRKADEPLS
jgi:HNH endonuclease